VSTELPFEPVIEPLGDHHNRAAFHCGNESLDRYLRQQVTQDFRRNIAVPFVLVDNRSGKVAGYYTLSNYGIEAGELPPELTRRLPHYPYIPATMLGRLAVDMEYQKRGCGKLLLMNAMHRSFQTSQQTASYALVVDAIDDAARAFYKCYDLTQFPNHPYRLFIPMATIARLFTDQA